MKFGSLVSSPVVQQLQSGAVEFLGHTNLLLAAQVLMGTRCLRVLVRVVCDLPLARPQDQPGLAHVPGPQVSGKVIQGGGRLPSVPFMGRVG